VAVALLGAGCAVGPDYEAPVVELPGAFVEAPSADVPGDVVPGSMWASFGEPELTDLIERARLHNGRVAVALATLNETSALSGLRVFSLFPTVTAQGDVERVQQSASDPFTFEGQGVTKRYRAGFDASWEIDIFGSLRRQAQQIVRLTEADAASLQAVQLSVTAETAQAWFALRGARRRLAILEQNLAYQAEGVAILEASLDAGRGTAFDVARARALERGVAATVPQARAEVARHEQRLAVLTNLPIEALRARVAQSGSMPELPRLTAVGTPDEWLRRRPDVLAAERRLAAATAGIGVETAEFYPKLTLLGEFGWTGSTASDIGTSGAERWRGAPTISWRFLDFGRVRQRVRAAEAAAARSMAEFEQTIRLALEETETSFANYAAAVQRAAALSEAVAEGGEAARLARLRFDAGASDYLAVLDAERTALDLQDQYALAITDRATALAALYKALGGDFAAAGASTAGAAP
jgi:multidrug efflux system outer membrane protein